MKPAKGGQVRAILTMNGSCQQFQEASAKYDATVRCSTKFCELTDAKFEVGENFENPYMRDDDREKKDAFSRPRCGCTRFDALNCLTKKEKADVLSQFCGSFRFCSESCIKGAIRVRGGALKSLHMLPTMTRQCNIYIHTQLPSIPQSRSSAVCVLIMRH